jgi:hypothetical protein
MYLTYKKTLPTLSFCLLNLMLINPMHVQAASLFGDHSCKDWGGMDYAAKKVWANAFLAPLSLTYQAIQKTGKDNYNDDPESSSNAVTSINNFCLAQPELDASAGAMNYLKILSGE